MSQPRTPRYPTLEVLVARNTVSRVLHDVGLAAWFGGTLANAVALNAAAAEATSMNDRGSVANTGWNRWTPVNAAAIGLHLTGSIGQLLGNKGRVAGHGDVAAMSATKALLTAGALAATAYARVLGRKVNERTDVPVGSGTTSHASTPQDVADAQAKLRALQWVIPALTGSLVGVSSFAGEQQRSGRLANVAEAVRRR